MANWTKFFAFLIALLVSASTALADEPPTEPFQFEQLVNLGVPAGNAPLPKFLALNSAERLLYIFSEGEPLQGNRLAVFDLETGEFSGQTPLNTGDFEPLGFQFDPANGLLYARWQERYTGAPPVLAVIDTKILQVSQQIPNIEAFAAGNGLLYAATATELLSVNLSNNSIEQAQRAPLPPAYKTGPMALDAANNRLYLARSGDNGPSIEIVEAGSLSALASYPADSDIINLLPLPATGQLFFTSDQGGFRILNRITSNGELADLPIELGPYSGAAGIATSPNGQSLFYSNGQWGTEPGEEPALIGLNSDSLAQTHTIPLLANVDALLINDQAAMAYALAPYDHHLYLIDLSRETFEIEATAITLRDVLFDAGANRLFVTDSANRVRALDPATLAPANDTRLQNNWADFGFKRWGWSGELALDTGREQLYVSGLPATVLDAATLAEISTIDPGGQLAPDPTSERLYVSNCGVTIFSANSLAATDVISGTAARADGLIPNPCVERSTLDSANQWLYSSVTNGVPGSNGGTYLHVFDVSAAPTLIFTNTELSLAGLEPDPAERRAFTAHVRNSNQRLRALDVAAGSFTHQLFGVWGEMRFSPASNRLYVTEQSSARLLILDAGTLGIINQLLLPRSSFRLVEIDPLTDRLFLIDDRGNLLTAAPTTDSTTGIRPPAGPPLQADGAVLSLAAPANAPVVARINSHFDQFSRKAQLFATTDGGQNWANIGGGLPPLPVQAAAVSPNFAQGQTLFAGLLQPGQSGGLYKSTDGGASWQPAMAGLRDSWVDALHIAPDFSKTGLLLAETTYGGLHLSTDAGETWQPLFEPDPNGLFPLSSADSGVAISQNTILVSRPAGEARGIYRATRRADGAPSAWQPVLDQPAQLLAASPNGQTVLAFGSALWRSTDGGRSWQIGGAGLVQETSAQPAQIIFSPNFDDDQTVYFFYRDASGDAQAIVFRSADGGQNWLPWQPPTDSPVFTALSLTPAGDFLLGDVSARLAEQPAAGARYAATNLPTAPFPIDSVAVSGNGSTLFAASGPQGLFKTGNGGRGWQRTAYPARSQTFGGAPFQVAVSASGRTVFVASRQSLHRSTDGGATWRQLSAGDGSLSFPAQHVTLSANFDDDRTLLVNTPTAVYRSTDGGENWAKVLVVQDESSASDVLVLAANGRTAFARFGYGQSLYRSDDGGQTWEIQPSSSGDEYFSIISAAADAGGTLSAAVEYDRKLLQTDAQTPPWRNLSDSLPAELTGMNAVAYHPDGTLFVAGSGGGLFSSTDNGQSWAEIPTYELPEFATATGLTATDTGLVVTLDNGEIYRLPAGETGWKSISIIK